MTQHQVLYKTDPITFQIVPKRIRHIYIKIYPDKKVVVTAPPHTDLKKIKDLVIKKGNWIRKKLNESIRKMELIRDNSLLFKGIYIPMEISPNVNKEKPVYTGEKILLSNKIRNRKKKLEEFLKDECFHYIAGSIDRYCTLLKVSYRAFTVKKIKRWGFCRSNRELVFNLFLIALPIRFIDYIILHEVTHLLHFNHSHRFKNILLKYFPDKKRIEKELKRYHLHL
ncbi:MAG: M48 family metallopeptidase [Spirochaetes bacterium]|nr:M48 family metallopeptidase [Spirochaetota bacterium]